MRDEVDVGEEVVEWGGGDVRVEDTDSGEEAGVNNDSRGGVEGGEVEGRTGAEGLTVENEALAGEGVLSAEVSVAGEDVGESEGGGREASG